MNQCWVNNNLLSEAALFCYQILTANVSKQCRSIRVCNLARTPPFCLYSWNRITAYIWLLNVRVNRPNHPHPLFHHGHNRTLHEITNYLPIPSAVRNRMNVCMPWNSSVKWLDKGLAAEAKCFSSPPRSDKLCGPPCLIFSGHRGFSPDIKRPDYEASYPPSNSVALVR
jgi:hypothetical protein